MDIRKDILGREPKVGDIIAFNPPAYKGLVFGEVLSFSKVGLPEINAKNNDVFYYGRNIAGRYSPKTGFVIAKSND